MGGENTCADQIFVVPIPLSPSPTTSRGNGRAAQHEEPCAGGGGPSTGLCQQLVMGFAFPSVAGARHSSLPLQIRTAERTAPTDVPGKGQ